MDNKCLNLKKSIQIKFKFIKILKLIKKVNIGHFSYGWLFYYCCVPGSTVVNSYD
jgi:hypothetical protein